MSISRFYSLGLGKYKNFTARTDGLITDADTTPDVSLYSLLYSNSTNIITYFDNAEEGQIIVVTNVADEALAFSGAQMKVTDSSNLWQNDVITFINHNSAFLELSRSHGGQMEVATASQADVTPSIKNIHTLYVNNSDTRTITAFDDGYEGQKITIVNVGSDTKIASTGNTVYTSNSGNLGLGDNVSFISRGGSWYEMARSTPRAQELQTAAETDTNPTVKNTKILVFHTDTNLTIENLDDGYPGQSVTLVNVGAGTITLAYNVAKLCLGRSAQNYALTASNSTVLVTPNGSVWYNPSVAGTAI